MEFTKTSITVFNSLSLIVIGVTNLEGVKGVRSENGQVNKLRYNGPMGQHNG